MTHLIQQLSAAAADCIEAADRSVVRVEARRRLPATGIVWADDLIVTAHHVVEYEEDIAVGLADDERIGAALVGRDPHNDLALLKAETALPAADWAEEGGLRVGYLALALGRPRQKIRASLGIVSGLVDSNDVRRKAKGQKHRRGRGKGGWRGGWGRLLVGGCIQTDLTMYPGFSGGPLLGGDGKVYGLNTSGFARGIGLAVPAATIGKSVDALLADGKIQQGYLGVGIQPARLPEAVSESLGQEGGLLVVSVEADSPAAKAGLMVGDIILALDEAAVEQVDELHIILANSAVGGEKTITLARGGALQKARAVIGARG